MGQKFDPSKKMCDFVKAFLFFCTKKELNFPKLHCISFDKGKLLLFINYSNENIPSLFFANCASNSKHKVNSKIKRRTNETLFAVLFLFTTSLSFLFCQFITDFFGYRKLYHDYRQPFLNFDIFLFTVFLLLWQLIHAQFARQLEKG